MGWPVGGAADLGRGCSDVELAATSVPLQRIQIVKGWVDSLGRTFEKVFEVAGDPNNGAGVDLDTCTPTGPGFDTLCTTWVDPGFDPLQRAFYYARVLENPTCRWSTYECNALGVDCDVPESVPPDLAACCSSELPKTVQERAWTSPIWYRPEGIGKLRAKVFFAPTAGADVLTLKADLGYDVGPLLATNALTLTVRDDDDVFTLTVPAGTFLQKGKRWVLTGAGGVEQLIIAPRKRSAATLKLAGGAVRTTSCESERNVQRRTFVRSSPPPCAEPRGSQARATSGIQGAALPLPKRRAAPRRRTLTSWRRAQPESSCQHTISRYRSSGVSPVRRAMRASIRKPISSPSWKANTQSGQPGLAST